MMIEIDSLYHPFHGGIDVMPDPDPAWGPLGFAATAHEMSERLCGAAAGEKLFVHETLGAIREDESMLAAWVAGAAVLMGAPTTGVFLMCRLDRGALAFKLFPRAEDGGPLGQEFDMVEAGRRLQARAAAATPTRAGVLEVVAPQVQAYLRFDLASGRDMLSYLDDSPPTNRHDRACSVAILARLAVEHVCAERSGDGPDVGQHDVRYLGPVSGPDEMDELAALLVGFGAPDDGAVLHFVEDRVEVYPRGGPRGRGTGLVGRFHRYAGEV